jgi:hypothetical protein
MVKMDVGDFSAEGPEEITDTTNAAVSILTNASNGLKFDSVEPSVDHDQLHSYSLRFYMAVSILNFTCNQMFPFDGHLLATSPQQTTKLQMNLTLTSIN